MSKQREAFKAFLELQRYCDNTRCEECCFCLGNDHDNEGYCVFDGGLAQADDEREEISKRVYFLEQLELEMGKMSEEKLPHWIEHEGGFVQDSFRADTYECSECGEYSIRQTPYCPHCGAKMVGEQEVRDKKCKQNES